MEAFHISLTAVDSRFGQALAAEFRIAPKTVPAIVDELAIGLLEAGRRGDDSVFPLGAIPVAHPIERRQYLTGKSGCLVQDGIDHVRRSLFTAGQGNDLFETGQFLHYKPHVLQWGNVFAHYAFDVAFHLVRNFLEFDQEQDVTDDRQ